MRVPLRTCKKGHWGGDEDGESDPYMQVLGYLQGQPRSCSRLQDSRYPFMLHALSSRLARWVSNTSICQTKQQSGSMSETGNAVSTCRDCCMVPGPTLFAHLAISQTRMHTQILLL